MIFRVLALLFCHLIGDYVLQTPFIASTKGKNWYHMFVHCALYCFPFWLFFGLNWQLAVVFVTHMIIDPMKARWGLIGYKADQLAHYGILTLYLFNDILAWDMFLTWALVASMTYLACDIAYFRNDHRKELEEYYRKLEK